MAYDRNTRDRNYGDYYGRPNSQDFGRDFASSGRSEYSSARDYAAAGELRDDGEQGRGGYGGDYGRGERYAGGGFGSERYAPRGDRGYRGGSYQGGGYQSGRAQGDRYGQPRYDRESEYHGSYASDGRRFEDIGRYRHADDDNYRTDAYRGDRSGGRGYGRQPQGYDYEDRGFFARAGDEVRSWFGDDDAERRREADARYDDRYDAGRARNDRDDHYHTWRSTQIAALDRDYDEYRSENRSKFENEFSTWRSERQGQRNSLGQVTEHMEVVGSDGSHVGTVDKVRGDRILLTRKDKDAGGVHHSIPSRWIQTVDTKVTLSKTADEAKAAWRDEDSRSAMFDYGDRTRDDASDVTKGRTLGKSFSGTY